MAACLPQRACTRTNGGLADVKSCGPGAATLALSFRAMIPRATVAKEPYTGEITV